MATELFPSIPESEPLEPQQQGAPRNLLHGKNVLLVGLVVSIILGMGTYIAVAPSEDRRVITAKAVFPPTPTPLPPTNTPVPPTVTPILLPTITLTPTPIIPPGTVWKTYTNTKQGYRIKYSPDWAAQDVGELDPKIPSYIAFNETSASSSSRFITVSVTTRTYDEQLALGASSSAITVAGIKGTKQYFQDSDGKTSTVVVLPRTNDLVVLRAKTNYMAIFNLMLSTLYVAR
jgi:hypothetical protein